MKSQFQIKILAAGLLMILLLSCRKEKEITTTVTNSRGTSGSGNQNTDSSTSQTLVFKANAGTDKLVFLPINFCLIGGGYSTTQNVKFRFHWQKLSGPSSLTIETPDSLSTKLSNLVKGIYSFEFTITSPANNTSKDTCEVIVNDLTLVTKEKVFENMKWGMVGLTGSTLLWGSSIIIRDVYNYIPQGSVFKVYIRRDGSTAWEELEFNNPNAQYSIDMMNGSLGIWSDLDEKDTPDIKLVY